MVLSMPETHRRRAHFVNETLPGLQREVTVFDGVRYNPGWLGCAMSYHYLARKALQAGAMRLEVMEDDVEMPPDYALRRGKVDAWLQQHDGQWDIFAGLIAHNTQGLKLAFHQIGDDRAAVSAASNVGALALFISFINLFQFLLLMMSGDRR